MADHYDYKTVSLAATGSWEAILSAHGIEMRKLNQNGPCPLCGGHDRAHFFEREGRIMNYCRHGCGNSGPGNEVSTPEYLIMEKNGWQFPDMVRAVAEYLRVTPEETIRSFRAQSMARASKPASMPAGHREDPEKSLAQLEKCKPAPTHKYLIMNNTASHGDVLTLGKFLAVELFSQAGELVNIAALGVGDAVHYAAGGVSFGATARLKPESEHDGRIILARDYAEAWRIWWKECGKAEVRAAISVDNFIYMTRRCKSQFTHVACTQEEIEEFEEIGCDTYLTLPIYKGMIA